MDSYYARKKNPDSLQEQNYLQDLCQQVSGMIPASKQYQVGTVEQNGLIREFER